MKRLYLMSALMLLLPGTASATNEILDLKNGTILPDIKQVATIPTRDVVTDADGNITVTYEFSKIRKVEDPNNPGKYFFHIDGFGLNTIEGEPAYPLRNDSFVSENGNAPTISIIEIETVEYDLHMAPAMPLEFDNGSESIESREITPEFEDMGYPSSPVEEGELSVYRGHRLFSVSVNPISYNAPEGKIQVCKKLVYKLDFSTPQRFKKGSNEITYPAGFENELPDTYLLNTALNLDSETTNSMLRVGGNDYLDIFIEEGYLILTVPKYKAEAERLAGWKTLMGFNTEVISASSWSTENIYNKIKERYTTVPNLKYVVLFGNFSDLPGVRGTYGKEVYYTDFHYGCMDSFTSDWEQDLSIGRLSPANITDAQTIVSKIINYDKIPTTNSNYYQNPIHCGAFDAPDGKHEEYRLIKTSEEIRNYMFTFGKTPCRQYFAFSDCTPMYWNKGYYGYGEALPADLQKPYFAWNASVTSINNAWKAGAYYILYISHGAASGWALGRDYAVYKSSDIPNCTNGLPFVFNMACSTANNKEDGSFAEMLLRKKDGGAVGSISAVAAILCSPNDLVATGLFDAMYPEPGLEPMFPDATGSNSKGHTPTFVIADILKHGLLRMSERSIIGSSTKNLEKRLFHIIGDPSMRLRSEYKGQLKVTPKASSSLNNLPGFTLNLSNLPSDVIVTAYDSITGAKYHHVGRTFSFNSDHADKVALVIHAHNYAPIVTTAATYAIEPVGPIFPGLLSEEDPSNVLKVSRNGSAQVAQFVIPISSASAYLLISDTYGKEYKQIPLVTSERIGEITLPSLNSGIYTVSLFVDNEKVAEQRIII